MFHKKIFLITSGAYGNDEITSDFGFLPTSFLPVGHKRLVELQLDLISSFNGIKFVTLPDNFDLSLRDKNLIELNKVKIHWTNPNLSLSQSILSFLNAIDSNTLSRFCMLHGDTLFEQIEDLNDIIYCGETDLFYKWGRVDDFNFKNNCRKEKNSVISGYFTFGDIDLLKKELSKSNSFELALKGYNAEKPLRIINNQDWLDFGHSNLYYKSKRYLNVTRNFNSVIVENNHIRKKSTNNYKIISEYKWFKQIPENLKVYLPAVWDLKINDNSSSYMIEFIGAPTLQEKFVFGNLPEYSYFKIIDSVFDFIEKIKNYTYTNIAAKDVKFLLNELYINKTRDRVNLFIEQTNYNPEKAIIINEQVYTNLNFFLEEVLSQLNNRISKISDDDKLTIMHGDLCFSNILFDSRSNSLKLIDPRGGLNNNFNQENKILGDYQYDIAKLGHSLIGNYDFIVSGYYNLNHDLRNYKFYLDIETKGFKALEKYFYDKISKMGVSHSFIKASITNLFLSMLPLHDEDKNRQLALLLNAYKFYYN